MGGLFSSEQTPTPRPTTTRNYSYSYESQRTPVRQPVSSTTPPNYQCQISRLQRDFESLSVYGSSSRQVQTRQVTSPIRSVRDTNRFFIGSDPFFNSSSIVTYIELASYDDEYQQVIRKITNKRRFRVDSIEKIENPYLKRAYQLKKEQKQKEYFGLEEKLLFHGTTRANFEKICKFNFDWRLCKTHKFGKGVSFSPNANYASNYSDKNIYNKIMIVAKVLVGRSCIGNERMVLPLYGCDTSQKPDKNGMEDGIVTVKYEDNEYLPVYKINYHIVMEQIASRPRKNSLRGGGFVAQYYFDDSDDIFDDYYD